MLVLCSCLVHVFFLDIDYRAPHQISTRIYYEYETLTQKDHIKPHNGRGLGLETILLAAQKVHHKGKAAETFHKSQLHKKTGSCSTAPGSARNRWLIRADSHHCVRTAHVTHPEIPAYITTSVS